MCSLFDYDDFTVLTYVKTSDFTLSTRNTLLCLLPLNKAVYKNTSINDSFAGRPDNDHFHFLNL